MSLVTFNFESQYLGNNHNVGIILPDRPSDMPAKTGLENQELSCLLLSGIS